MPIPDEVKAGMALLDEKVPGWREKIDPDILNMQWCGYCVLGQVFGDYYIGLTELGIMENNYFSTKEEEKARDLGFHVYGFNWDDLTQAWREVLS